MISGIHVVKIGGQVADQPQLLGEFLKQFSRIEGPKILIHGGGKSASDLLERLGIESKMFNGRRITDADTLEVVTMVYAGQINKKIVALLQSMGVNSLGLSGADLNLIQAHKRIGGELDFGFAGDIDRVNIDILKDLMVQGVVPVLCSITHDKKGQLLNTNADTIASSVAVALSPYFPVHLVYCFEIDGVIKNMETGEIFDRLNKSGFETAQSEGLLTGGILPKLSTAFEALEAGVEAVVICNHKALSQYGDTDFHGTIMSL